MQTAVLRRVLAGNGTAALWYWSKQSLLWLGVPLALFLLLVSQIPPLHNATHELRHSLLNLVCH